MIKELTSGIFSIMPNIISNKKAVTKISFAVLGIFALMFSVLIVQSVIAPVTTDKQDYAPGKLF